MTSRTSFYTCLAALAVVCLLVSCTPDGDPAAPSTGSMYGTVLLIDEYSDVQSVYTGVTVRAVASSGKSYTTAVDVNGNWKLDGLPAEVYAVSALHPDYDSTMHVFGNHKNLVHPGAGSLSVVKLTLQKVPAMDLVRIIESRSFNQKDSSWDGHGYWRYRSTYKFSATIQSKEDRPLPNISYNVISTNKPDVSCDERLDHEPYELTRDGNRITLTLTHHYVSLPDSTSKPMQGITRYFQIRRSYSRWDPISSKQVEVCMEPFVVPYNL